MTGVSVDVDKVAIKLADGRGEIGGLVVENPKGYEGPHAFKLGFHCARPGRGLGDKGRRRDQGAHD